MTSSVILSARRTPVGRFFGGYSRVASPQLGAFAVEAALVSAGVDGADIDECIMGCVLQAGLGQNPARQAALKGGLFTSCDDCRSIDSGWRQSDCRGRWV